LAEILLGNEEINSWFISPTFSQAAKQFVAGRV